MTINEFWYDSLYRRGFGRHVTCRGDSGQENRSWHQPSIAVVQQKGGAGKTTLAAQLALAWASMHERVAVVDIDPQGSLGRWFALRDATVPPEGRLDVTVNSVQGWRVASEIDRMVRDHTIVLVDSPPHAQSDTKNAVRAAHLIVVPVQPSPLDLWATQPTLDLAKDERVPALLVLNRVPARTTLTEITAKALAELGAPVTAARLGNRVGFAASMAAGRGVIETAPHSAAGTELAALAAEIIAHARQLPPRRR